MRSGLNGLELSSAIDKRKVGRVSTQKRGGVRLEVTELRRAKGELVPVPCPCLLSGVYARSTDSISPSMFTPHHTQF